MGLFSSKSTESIDWVGQWYLIAKKLGQSDMNVFGRARWNPDTRALEEIQRKDFSHSKMDGAGAMVTYMRELGDREIDFPVSDRNTRPPLWQRPGQLLRSQKLMGQSRAAWTHFNAAKPARLDDFSVFVFLKDEAQKLRTYCRNQGFSPNAWILSLLHQEAAYWLKDQDSIQAWLMPVNMRGGVKKADHAVNHSSAVPLFVSRQSSPKAIHAQLKERLAGQIHWGNWWAYNSSKFMSSARMEKLYSKSATKNFWMGTLSDMGQWHSGAGYQSLGPNEIWFASAPGSKNYPICCVPFGFNGNLSVTVKVHPSIVSLSRPDQDLATRLEGRMRKVLGLPTPEPQVSAISEESFR